MQLTIQERILLGNLLPKVGDFTTLRLVRGLMDDLSFSEDEHKLLKFKRDGQLLSADPEGAAKVGSKDIIIPSTVHELVRAELQKRDAEKKLELEHLSLYEKFVPNQKERKATAAQKKVSEAPAHA